MTKRQLQTMRTALHEFSVAFLDAQPPLVKVMHVFEAIRLRKSTMRLKEVTAPPRPRRRKTIPRPKPGWNMP